MEPLRGLRWHYMFNGNRMGWVQCLEKQKKTAEVIQQSLVPV